MKTKHICLQGLMVALVTIATMIFQIPVPATNGYIHLGDSMILLIGIFFGARYGMIAGGLGSALADILTGYAHWAPFTFIIKALMGYIVGKIGHVDEVHNRFVTVRNIIACIIAIVCMVVGYYFGGAILEKSFAVAITSIPSNLIQGFAGLLIACVVGVAFSRAKIYQYVSVK